MLLFLLRHGQSEYNLIGEKAGADSPLTPLGWKQAERAGIWLGRFGHFDALYTSPLLRARQTAEGALRHLSAPAPVVIDALRESEFHLLEVLPQFEHPLDPVCGQRFSPLPARYQTFRRQVQSAVQQIVGTALASAHERVLVVSHGGTIGTIVRLLIGCHGISIWTHNCGVHCLGWTDGRWEIRFMNHTHFLDGLDEQAVGVVE